MLNRQISFEWHNGEEAFQQWGMPPGGVIGHMQAGHWYAHEQQIAHWAVRVVSLIAAALVLATGASLTFAQFDYLRLRSGIDQTLRLETQAWLTHDRDLFDSLVDRSVEGRWLYTWRRHLRTDRPTQHSAQAKLVDVTTWGDYALATVEGTHPVTEWWEYERYMETRFYRPTSDGWLRTLPPADFWGEQHTSKTPHFMFVYYGPDAQAVQAASARLEPAYAYLQDLLDLPEPTRAGKQAIAIVPERNMGLRAFYGQWELVSPTLLTVPEGWTAADQISAYLVERLIYRAVNQHWPGFSSLLTYRWPMMLVSMTGWMQTDITGLQSPWRRDAERVFVEYGAQHFPIDLQVITELKQDGQPNRQRVIWRYVAAESVIDYAVQEYGRATLPDLMEAFLTRDSWDTVIWDVYGLPVEEFAAGWNRYLADKYNFTAP